MMIYMKKIIMVFVKCLREEKTRNFRRNLLDTNDCCGTVCPQDVSLWDIDRIK